MKHYYEFLFSFVLTISISSCRKNDAPVSDKPQTLIQQARLYFVNEIKFHDVDSLTTKTCRGHQTPRQQSSRKPNWDKAYVAHLTFGNGVVVPVMYTRPFIINSNFGGKKIYNINDLGKLLIYQDKGNNWHHEMITAFPDTNYNNQYSEKFKGLILVEDWWGNPLNKYKYDTNGDIQKYDYNKVSSAQTSEEIEESRLITVCYEISGYNYSSNSPDSGSYWTEPAGCQSYFIPDGGGISYGSGSIFSGVPTGGDYGSVPLGNIDSGYGYPINPVKNMAVLRGNNTIRNIKDYDKCFINTPGSDHSYQVRLCVSQPAPGTRDTWGFDDPDGSTTNSNPVFVGHSFLVLTETTPTRTITRNVGFYPKSSASPFSPTDQGQLNNDEMHDYDISLAVTVTSGQFFQILDFIEQGNSSGYLYNLNYNNCTTFALNAFSRIGINLPRTQGKWLNGGGLNPGDLGEDIRSMTLSSNMTRTGIYGSHPNQGTCN